MNYYQLLQKPYQTEKCVDLKEKENKVTFVVSPSSNKTEIKKAVETIFKVKVLNVQTVSCKGKEVSRRGRLGKKSDWKKAYVTLKKGDKIDYFEGG